MNHTEVEPLWRTEARWVAAVAARLADPGFPTGEHAVLRRMDPHAPAGRVEIAVERLFRSAGAEPDGRDRKRWLLIIHCLALARGRHAREETTGRVLAELRYSEERLNRLFSTDFEVVADMMPRLARLLGAKGSAIDWLPLARIIRWTERNEDRADQARLRIARTYARAAAN